MSVQEDGIRGLIEFLEKYEQGCATPTYNAEKAIVTLAALWPNANRTQSALYARHAIGWLQQYFPCQASKKD